MLIDLFIKNSWYTVPLKGVLERTADGDKTVPEFESNWKEKYTKNFNTNSVKLAGALTGSLSGIVAIDCDNQFTYDLIKSFDPDYKFHFVSKGKPSGGGTIIYRYNSDIPTYKFHMDTVSLDFYSDNGFIYLPTEHNKTKESWEDVYELPELGEMPDQVYKLVKAFGHKAEIKSSIKTKEIKHNISNRLAPMLEQFLTKKEYNPVLFKILTPYSFRDTPDYISKGHLHPNDVPQGRGSEYLSKISAILGADISVNAETYINTMYAINNLWEKPMEKGRINATIINPMVDGRINIEGVPIWQYDEYWQDTGLVATALNGDYIESFYDDIKSTYYIVNYTVGYVKTFSEKAQVIKTIKTMTGRGMNEQSYDIAKQIIRTDLIPSQEFGHVQGTDLFNLFRQSQELAILNNPEAYKGLYQRPEATIKFMETLVPDDKIRMYLLRFIRTKLTTFKYSPVVPYFIGKAGSGKDTFVTILRRILGDQYIAKPDSKVFLEQYNGWLLDQFFVQLDEYGNKLSRGTDKQEVLGKIKAYTGSDEIQIRAMRTDGFNYRHNITFILTANNNPLPVEIDDRRFLFVTTPNKLAIQDWVVNMGGITAVQNKIKNETQNFCYYLATELTNLADDDYMLPPDTEDKEEAILENLPAAERLLYFITNEKMNELYELSVDYNIRSFKDGWDKGRLHDDRLEELYSAMTDGHGEHRVIIRMLKKAGIYRQHTTRGGNNFFYYNIDKLRYYSQTEGDFESIDDTNKVKPKGL